MATIQNVSTAGTGNQVVGKVVILYGTVKAISADGTVRLLAPNSPIFANDQIITESDGRVSIMFDGAPPSQMDLGRMSTVVIDEDVYAGPTSTPASDVTADLEEIQKALLAGDEPIELEAPAAGGGGAGGGHKLFVINPTGAEVTPTSGAETIGVTFGTPGTVEGSFNQPGNNPPDAVNDVAAENDALVTPEDTPLTIAAATLTANDSDPDGDAFSITGFTQTEHGTLVQNPDGSFTYTPNENYNGPDSFTYTITDANGATDTATVSIDVTPVNDAPDAVNDLAASNDALVTPEDTPLTIAAATLTANDSDPDGDAFSITGFTQTEHGTLVQNPDGSFTYTPNSNYNGPDSFTYTITDEHGATDTATVTIDVTPVDEPPPVDVNDPPVANDTSASGDEGATVAVTLSGSDIDGTVTQFQLTSLPADGKLYLDAAATQEVTLSTLIDASGEAATLYFKATDENWNGQTTFNYTAIDNDSLTDATPALGTITLGSVNDAPVAIDNSYTATEDTLLTDLNIITDDNNGQTAGGVDYDVSNDTLTIATVNGAAFTANGTDPGHLAADGWMQVSLDHGTAFIKADGTTNYQANLNDTTGDTFTYTISDGDKTSNTATVSIGITPDNDAPVAIDNSYTATEDTLLTDLNIITDDNNGQTAGGVDYDVDSSSLTIATVNGAAFTANGTDPGHLAADGWMQVSLDHGTAFIKADGTTNYQANLNDTTGDTFTYTISDGDKTSNTATVSIGITPDNDAPDLSDFSVRVSEEGLTAYSPNPDDNPTSPDDADTTNSYNVSGTLPITDVDGGTYTITVDENLVNIKSGGETLSWDGKGTGSLTGYIGTGADRTNIITIEVTDIGGYSVTLRGPVDHPNNTTEDVLSFPVDITVNQDGGGSDTATLTVYIEDDSPLVNGTTDAYLSYDLGDIETGTLGINYGADGPAAPSNLSFKGISNGDPVMDSVLPETQLTAEDIPLVYQIDSNGDLLAVKSTDYSYVAFKVELDATGSGSYTVTIVDGLDGAPTSTTVDLTDSSSIHGGNVEGLLIDVILDGEAVPDALLVASATSNNGELDTVNYNTNGMGVGAGCKIDPGDILRLEYHAKDGSGDPADFQTMDQAKISAWHLDDAESVTWKAYVHVGDTEHLVGQGDFTGTSANFDIFTVSANLGTQYNTFDTITFESTTDIDSSFGINQITIQDTVNSEAVDHAINLAFGATDADLDSTGVNSSFDITFDADLSNDSSMSTAQLLDDTDHTS